MKITFSKICLVIFISSCFITTVFAQPVNRIAQDSIFNYRNTLYKQLNNNAFNSVTVKTEALELNSVNKASLPNSPHYFLTLNEIESIYLLQSNFEGVLKILLENDFEMQNRKRIVKSTDTIQEKPYLIALDSLSLKIGLILQKNKVAIEQQINATTFDAETKDFLTLFLHYKLAYHYDVYNTNNLTPAEEINTIKLLDKAAMEKGNTFIERYPQSKFNSFIKQFVLATYDIKKWAIGLDWGIGSVLPHGNLSTYIKPALVYTSLGIKGYYKNAFVQVSGGIGNAFQNTSFFKDTLWTRSIAMFTGELTAGYAFDFGNKLSIQPFVGVRKIVNIGPSGSFGASTLGSSLPYSLGVVLNFSGKSIPAHHINPQLFVGASRGGFNLKLHYQNPNYEKTVPELKGGLWTITAGFSLARYNSK